MSPPGFYLIAAVTFNRDQVLLLHTFDQANMVDTSGGGAVDAENVGVVYVIL